MFWAWLHSGSFAVYSLGLGVEIQRVSAPDWVTYLTAVN